MSKELVATNLNLKPGTVVRVVVEISPGARTIRIDMGTNENNLALHFNPRFEYQADRNIVIFNNKHDGKYGKEHREKHFPFLKGTTVEVLIEFEGTSFVVKLPDGYRMTFPNRTEITKIEYLAVLGDMSVKALAFE